MADLNRKINIWINDKQVVNSYKGITASMRKARNQLAGMTIGSKDYVNQTKKIKGLQKILDKHKAQQGIIRNGWAKMKNEIKSYATGNLLSSGITTALQKIGEAFNFVTESTGKAEQGLANVLTLMSEADISQYENQLKTGASELLAMGNQQDKVNKAMFDSVSAGIEAGKSIDFLKNMTVLSKGGVTDLSIAVDGTTTIMNAFSLEMDEATNIADAFFSAQKRGKTTVSELSSTIGKTAKIAKVAGSSYQELLSASAELTKQGISTDVSMTSLKGLFTSLLKPSAEAEKHFKRLGIPIGATALKAEGFTGTLEKLNKAILNNPDMATKLIPNVRGLTAALALSGDGFTDYKEILNEVTNDIGYNSSLQRAYNRQMETLPNILAKAKGETTALALELGQKFAPVIKAVIPFISGMKRRIIEFITFLQKNSKIITLFAHLIIIATTALVSYKLAIKLSTLWTNRIKIATLKNIVVQKLETIAFKANVIATTTLGVAKALLTGNIKKLRQELKLLNVTMKANPIGLAIAAITAAVIAYQLLKDKTKELTQEQKNAKFAQEELTDAHNKAEKSIAKDISKLRILLNIAKDETKSKKYRLEAINKLNEISPEYLGNLTLETINTNNTTKAINTYIKALHEKAKAQALSNKLTEIEEKLLDVRQNKELSSYKQNIDRDKESIQTNKKTLNDFRSTKREIESQLTHIDWRFDISLKQKEDLKKPLSDELETVKQHIHEVQSVLNFVKNRYNDTKSDMLDSDAYKKEQELLAARKLFESQINLTDIFSPDNYGSGNFNPDPNGQITSSYQNFYKEIQNIREKAGLKKITEQEKQLYESQKHYAEIASVIDDSINVLEEKADTKAGLNKEESSQLNSFYQQRIMLTKLQEEEITTITKDFEEKRLQEKKKAQAKIEEILLSDKDKEIKVVTEKYTKLIELAEKYEIETVDLYTKMNEELDDINDKYSNSDKKGPFGMTDDEFDDWKSQVMNIINIVDKVGQAWNRINDMRSNSEKREMQRYDENMNKRKKLLDRQLQQGLISEKNYNLRISGLEENREAKARIFARNKAKRDKSSALFNASVNTNAAIAQALPNIPLSVAVGILGALEIAAIASEPLPAYGTGARIDHPHYALVGEKGSEIILSNKILSDPVFGPIADDLARIQEGKPIRSFQQPNVPNFEAINKTTSSISAPNTTNNQTQLQVQHMTSEIGQMLSYIKEMTNSIKNIKHFKAIISQQQLDDRDEEDELLKYYSNF